MKCESVNECLIVRAAGNSRLETRMASSADEDEAETRLCAGATESMTAPGQDRFSHLNIEV